MFASLVALALLSSPPCAPLQLRAEVSPDLREVKGTLVCHRPEGAPDRALLTLENGSRTGPEK